ncbi:glycoside hydrolase family 2 protein [Xylanibacter muris]|uniref:beta-galactosidase n=1 Tax=Xylanibacter muris TaxID=2736290 RepID=A0ABX2ALE2_9BACT|nr:glycoside hydrolase family 2 TIM barrel-domain containing protein [Xylanibacter muris]NPD91034.1 beta-galactosidase [Xylanibacter muris]
MRQVVISCLLLCCFQATAQQTEIKYLSGTDADNTVAWDFFCSKGMNSGKWKKIAVPSCWEQQGFGEYTYGRYYKKKDGRVSDESGRYRHTFRVPKEWAGKKVELVFEGVMTDACVKINGREPATDVNGFPGVHRGGFTAFSYDVTGMVEYGKKNILEVFVEKQSKDKSVNAAERRADWWLFGGIYRPVYLRALPKINISRVAVDAKADGKTSIRLVTDGLADGYSLKAYVSRSGAAEDLPAATVRHIRLRAEREQTVETAFDGVRPWDPEHPNMYVLHLSLVDSKGVAVHEISLRIGFRTVEFRRRDGFYLNGQKLLIKGINRHCFYPETGRTTSRRLDIEDVKLVKGMNANAIRSHYPPDGHLLDICDSLGVLYFNELPGWQNHYNTQTGKRILHEMIAHDVNHPCIFVWGNGNEGGFNLELDSLFHEYDIQKRHVVHPWALFGGVDAHHYPAYQTGVGRLGNGYDVFMPTEFLHAQYDKGAGASLDDYWRNWSRSSLFAGGFIWALIDEGVVRKDLNDSIDTDGPNAPDGVLGPHREKEGSWYTIRDVWSPVQIDPVTVRPSWNCRLALSNNSLFSCLDEYVMTYEVISAGTDGRNVLREGRVRLPHALPGEKAGITLPLTEDELNAGYILQLTAMYPSGDTVNIWTWPMKYADEYFAGIRLQNTEMSGKADFEDAALYANGVKVVFSKETGMIVSVNVKGRDVPFNNGPLPVGMRMRLKDFSARKDGNDALMVMRYTGAADSIVWRMTPDGVLGMDAVIFNRRDGGKYDGAFFDNGASDIGFSFSYPESVSKGMRWFGRGPYRVWRNRKRGTLYNIWYKDYNNTITGEGKLIYPEFKGYHANMYWAKMESDTAPFAVYTETDGIYYRVFTPEEPRHRRKGEDTMQAFPDGDISFLFDIQGMRSYKPIEQLGPDAQSSNIRINKGDDGLRMRLWFDFRAD